MFIERNTDITNQSDVVNDIDVTNFTEVNNDIEIIHSGEGGQGTLLSSSMSTSSSSQESSLQAPEPEEPLDENVPRAEVSGIVYFSGARSDVLANNVTVTIQGQNVSAVTDGSGHFQISGVDASDSYVTIEVSGQFGGHEIYSQQVVYLKPGAEFVNVGGISSFAKPASEVSTTTQDGAQVDVTHETEVTAEGEVTTELVGGNDDTQFNTSVDINAEINAEQVTWVDGEVNTENTVTLNQGASVEELTDLLDVETIDQVAGAAGGDLPGVIDVTDSTVVTDTLSVDNTIDITDAVAVDVVNHDIQVNHTVNVTDVTRVHDTTNINNTMTITELDSLDDVLQIVSDSAVLVESLEQSSTDLTDITNTVDISNATHITNEIDIDIDDALMADAGYQVDITHETQMTESSEAQTGTDADSDVQEGAGSAMDTYPGVTETDVDADTEGNPVSGVDEASDFGSDSDSDTEFEPLAEPYVDITEVDADTDMDADVPGDPVIMVPVEEAAPSAMMDASATGDPNWVTAVEGEAEDSTQAVADQGGWVNSLDQQSEEEAQTLDEVATDGDDQTPDEDIDDLDPVEW